MTVTGLVIETAKRRVQIPHELRDIKQSLLKTIPFDLRPFVEILDAVGIQEQGTLSQLIGAQRSIALELNHKMIVRPHHRIRRHLATVATGIVLDQVY